MCEGNDSIPTNQWKYPEIGDFCFWITRDDEKLCDYGAEEIEISRLYLRRRQRKWNPTIASENNYRAKKLRSMIWRLLCRFYESFENIENSTCLLFAKLLGMHSIWSWSSSTLCLMQMQGSISMPNYILNCWVESWRETSTNSHHRHGRRCIEQCNRHWMLHVCNNGCRLFNCETGDGICSEQLHQIVFDRWTIFQSRFVWTCWMSPTSHTFQTAE